MNEPTVEDYVEISESDALRASRWTTLAELLGYDDEEDDQEVKGEESGRPHTTTRTIARTTEIARITASHE